MHINVSVDAKMMTYVLFFTKACARVSKMGRVVQKCKEIDVKSTYRVTIWLTTFSNFLMIA